MGPSWASLGALLGHLGAILRPRKAIGSEKARKQKTLIFHWFLKDFGLLGGLLGRLRGHLEPSWNGLGASCRHAVSYLDPCLAILCAIGGHLGLSEAILEPSWAILGAPTPREPPRPGPGEGVGGGVNPSPKGKNGVWKRKLPRPPSPRGLVGLRHMLYSLASFVESFDASQPPVSTLFGFRQLCSTT